MGVTKVKLMASDRRGMSLLLHEVHGCLEIRVSNTRGVRKTPTYLLCDKINIVLFNFSMLLFTFTTHSGITSWVRLGCLACKIRRVVPETQVPQQRPKFAIQCVSVVNVAYVWICCSPQKIWRQIHHTGPHQAVQTQWVVVQHWMAVPVLVPLYAEC